MELHNYMEDATREVLRRILPQSEAGCKCEKCQMDIIALTLNSLPSKYIVTNRGRVYAKLTELEQQFKADIVKEVTKAIKVVKDKPQH